MDEEELMKSIEGHLLDLQKGTLANLQVSKSHRERVLALIALDIIKYKIQEPPK